MKFNNFTKNELTLKELAQSNEFRSYISNINKGIGNRYKAVIDTQFQTITQNGENCAGFTYNSNITLNIDHHLYEGSISHGIMMVLGTNFHECLHVLLTDMDLLSRSLKLLNTGNMLGIKHKYQQDLSQYLKKSTELAMIIMRINNILEDAFIERIGVLMFPGKWVDALNYLNSFIIHSNLKAEELINQNNIFCGCMNGILQYAKFEKDITKNLHHSNQCRVFINRNRSLIRRSLLVSAEERMKISILLCCELFPLIKELLEKSNERSQESDDGSQKSNEGSQESRDSSRKLEFNIGNISVLGETVIPTGQIVPKNEIKQILDNASKASESDSSKDDQFDFIKIDYNIRRALNLPNLAKAAKAEGKIIYYDDLFSPVYSELLRNFQSIVKSVYKEKEKNVAFEKQRNELIEISKNTYLGALHENVNFHVFRNIEAVDKAEKDLMRIRDECYLIAKRLAEFLALKIQNKEAREPRRNQYTGNQLTPSAIHRGDLRYFESRVKKSTKLDFAFSILIDQSGSMQMNDRIVKCRIFGIIVNMFCEIMKIPVSIAGHNSPRTHNVAYYQYQMFDKFDRLDQNRIMTMSAYDRNRDGAAMKFSLEQLKNRKEKNKILIVVSDGLPNDLDYSGYLAEKDITNIITEYKRYNINTIGVGIGDDIEVLSRIYKENYVSLSDMSKMPEKLIEKIANLIADRI